ncbi:hypothetical protein TTHERM_00266580 (macronuclear) [Tetrahymena thermophila SB210]|uniref:Uncharacterized protein n=1 Tax=Tetrahymena thermophila (strain SB210) TaxID=312017 RepID=I7MIX9_TETTS|nr:hypothetical protein TTHERM_00266580 [Tetrahymena thermophila SB210]EAR95648.2 hypothetical protein TTHERM_00266580 [Tetrahymena thermophila SB210]|eukprot:XP_001015893.2 hypothetical protein TTHERM_00266580 [Tetrahymena thermophila SB210]
MNMFGNSALLGPGPQSPPQSSNLSQFSLQDDFNSNKLSGKKYLNSFGASKDMSFSKQYDENEGAGSSFMRRNNNFSQDDKRLDSQFNVFVQNYSQDRKSQDMQPIKQKQNKNIANQSGDYGGILQFGSDFSNASFQSKKHNQQKQNKIQNAVEEDNSISNSPRQLSPGHQMMLKKSLEYLTPNIIDQGLKQLRQMNEVTQSRPLASASIIYNHCIDEEEIVNNIKGLARELKNIGAIEKELQIEYNEKMKDKTEVTEKKKQNYEIFTRLYKDAEEKLEKQKHYQLEAERQIEKMTNLSAVNKKSEHILKEKSNYVKIQDRVDQIIKQKRTKIDQAHLLIRAEENQQIKQNSLQKRSQVNLLNQNMQNLALDYSQSTENNFTVNSNIYKAQDKDKSFSLSQAEINANNNQEYGNKGYTKRQLEEFINRNERKKQIVHEQILEKKLQKEQKELQSATFHPKINKKSEQIAQASWEPIEERVEKMQEKIIEKRRKQCESEYSKYSYSPLINRKSSQIATKLNRTPLNKSYNNLNRSLTPFNKSLNQTQDLSTSRNQNPSSKNISQRPQTAFEKSKNLLSTTQIKQIIQKNDSQLNITSFNRNDSSNKMKQNQIQGKSSQTVASDNVSLPSRQEKVNLNELQKEDYFQNFTQQYALQKDQSAKLNRQNSQLSGNSKPSSINQVIEKQQDQIKQNPIIQQFQNKQRSISQITANQQNEAKSPVTINKTANNQQAKSIPLNKDNKFLLNMLNKYK